MRPPLPFSPVSDLPRFRAHRGYLESCRSIVSAARTIASRIRTEIPELRVLGNPPASVVAFAAAHGQTLNVLEVGDAMGKKGWHLNGISNPPAVHIAVTVRRLLSFVCFCFLSVWVGPRSFRAFVSRRPLFGLSTGALLHFRLPFCSALSES